MKILVPFVLFILPVIASAEPGDINNINLETGVALTVEEINSSRILPHAYYDQAISSIPGVYPGSIILAKQRFFQLGSGESRTYNSIVCYKKVGTAARVTISGIATYKTFAWRFETEVDEGRYSDTLVLVMEAISGLPARRFE
jgi:hypothetical protein